MDGLIALLIIIGVVTSISKSGKKKKAAEAQRKAEKPSPAQPKASATKIPYTREEWEQFLADAEGEAAAKPAPAKKAAAKPAAQKRKVSAPQMNVAAPAPAAMSTGSIALDPKQSVEGETEAEHAVHRLRAAQEDMRIGVERAAEQAFAEVNLQALRSAVVMKEILDKPVSLRPRRRYY
ncbi:MAG: hypothetical protein Q4G06_03685 [Clostridia bacterium]|nr:hypothetical protein [Clostridia bacterium]